MLGYICLGIVTLFFLVMMVCLAIIPHIRACRASMRLNSIKQGGIPAIQIRRKA